MKSVDIKIYEIGSFMMRNYILKTSQGFIVIDTGYYKGFKTFVKKFEGIGNLKDISHIFLTHAHDDHAGFLNELLDITDAKLVLNPLGVPALEEGKSAEPEGSGYSTRLASLFGVFKKDFTFPPVHLRDNAVYIKSDEDQYFNDIGLPLQILTLPGHTSDSIGLFMKETGILFCGDAAMNAIISLGKHTIFMEDVAGFQNSWDKMISLNPTKIYPSHGNPFLVRDLIKFRHFMDGRKLIN